MQAEISFITPQIASDLLAKNSRNRPIKKHHIDFLCDEIKNGRWKVNGDAIRISIDGELLDGQHRLEAIKRSGVGVHSLLISGLNSDVFDTIDCGAKRSAGDVLSISGEKNGSAIAAALVVVNTLLNSENPFSGRTKLSHTATLLMLREHANIRASLKWGEKLKRLAPQSIAVALHYLYSTRYAWKADEFFHLLSTGQCVDIDHPAYLLRNRLIENATSKGKISKRYMTALFIKAMNAFYEGRRLKTLRFRETGDCPEDFPSMVWTQK